MKALITLLSGMVFSPSWGYGLLGFDVGYRYFGEPLEVSAPTVIPRQFGDYRIEVEDALVLRAQAVVPFSEAPGGWRIEAETWSSSDEDVFLQVTTNDLDYRRNEIDLNHHIVSFGADLGGSFGVSLMGHLAVTHVETRLVIADDQFIYQDEDSRTDLSGGGSAFLYLRDVLGPIELRAGYRSAGFIEGAYARMNVALALSDFDFVLHAATWGDAFDVGLGFRFEI